MKSVGKRESAAVAFCAWFGVDAPLGSNFTCILPGHVDCRRASVYRDPLTEVYRYRCWRTGAWWSLAEVRAAWAYGSPRRVDGVERVIWYRRLWHETALIEVEPVELRVLGDSSAPANAQSVYDGFGYLLALRWLTTPGAPAPYARVFAGAWCGISEMQAQRSIAWLVDSGALKVVCKQKRTRLFLPQGWEGDVTAEVGRENVS